MAMGCRLNYQAKAPKTAPHCERLQSLRLRANRTVRRNYCEPYIDLKVIRADFFDFEAETGRISSAPFTDTHNPERQVRYSPTETASFWLKTWTTRGPYARSPSRNT